MNEVKEMQARIFDLEIFAQHIWRVLDEDTRGTVRYNWTERQKLMLIHLYGSTMHAIGLLTADCELCPASQWSKVEQDYHSKCRFINICLDQFQAEFDGSF